MPELPEVEVVKKSLNKSITKLIIKKIKINNNKLRYRISINDFQSILNKKIKNIKRRSKYLLIEMSNKKVILIHLGMTGKFFIEKKKNLKRLSFYYHLNRNYSHDHLIITLNNKSKLFYNDVRRFGFIKVYKKNDLNKSNHLKYLGPEPLSRNFNFRYLSKQLKKRSLKIKDFLMNQRVVSGLGNIYVNEILFSSKVLPKRKSSSLKSFEISKIISNTKKILKKSIRFGGSSIRDFKNMQGRSGKFQQEFEIYGKFDQNCSNTNCKGIIKLVKISNRATYYCNQCQK